MERTDGWPVDEVVQVDATGAACLIVHRTVFEKIAADYQEPWIWFQETKMGGKDVGEDITFCLRARGAGFPVHVDTKIQFGHMKMVNVNPAYYTQWIENHRFLITGTGRCGTGYMAHLLAASGVPCGHEQVYRPVGSQEWGWLRGESSWLAAPYLDRFNGHVVQLVRHPLAVIGSLVGIGFFNDELSDTHGPYRAYVDHRMNGKPEWADLDETEKAMLFVHYWNRSIEPHADQLIRVEDVTPEDLVVIARAAGANHSPIDFHQALADVPTNINTRNHTQIGWDDLPDGKLKTRLREQAKRYGYED
jgi:hypothetical protein